MEDLNLVYFCLGGGGGGEGVEDVNLIPIFKGWSIKNYAKSYLNSLGDHDYSCFSFGTKDGGPNGLPKPDRVLILD